MFKVVWNERNAHQMPIAKLLGSSHMTCYKKMHKAIDAQVFLLWHLFSNILLVKFCLRVNLMSLLHVCQKKMSSQLGCYKINRWFSTM